MSTNYSVVIDLKTVGSLDLGKGRGPEKAMSSMKAGWNDIRSAGSDVMGVLDGAVDRMSSFAKWGAIAAGAAGAGAIVYGVKDLNSELESTKISLGTIFAANGIASGVPQGMERASDIIKEMRKDARALPGEFEDLNNVFTTGAIDAFRAGATPEQWEKLASKVMASAKVAQVPMEVASREFAQLMEGRSGAHNVLGTRLFGLSGASAKKFNAEDDVTRYAELSKTIDKYSGSINEFGQSFDGLSSSLVDNGKNLLRQSTEPLFNAIKGELTDINGWFDSNQSMIDQWASNVGGELVDAFRLGKSEILLWEPAVEEFAKNAYAKLHEIWQDIGPTAESIGATIREALKDPGTLDKIIHLLELYAGLKLGGSLVGSLGSGAGRTGLGLNVAGTGIGAAAVGADGGSAGGFAAEAGAAVGGGALAGSRLGLLGAAAGAAVGSLSLAAASYQNYSSVKEESDRKAAEATWKFGEDLYNANAAASAYTHIQSDYMASVENWAARMDESGNTSEAALLRLSASAIEASSQLSAMVGAAGDARADNIANDAMASMMLVNKYNRGGMAGSGQAAADEAKKAKPVGGGHGGTSIQKVEIVVTSNQHPSRIARSVAEEFEKLANNPRSSRFTTDYTRTSLR